jgi:hypothetical protein
MLTAVLEDDGILINNIKNLGRVRVMLHPYLPLGSHVVSHDGFLNLS